MFIHAGTCLLALIEPMRRSISMVILLFAVHILETFLDISTWVLDC